MRKQFSLVLLISLTSLLTLATSISSSGYSQVSSKNWVKYSIDDIYSFGVEKLSEAFEAKGFYSCEAIQDYVSNAYRKTSGSNTYYKFEKVGFNCFDNQEKPVQVFLDFIVKRSKSGLKLYDFEFCFPPIPIPGTCEALFFTEKNYGTKKKPVLRFTGDEDGAEFQLDTPFSLYWRYNNDIESVKVARGVEVRLFTGECTGENYLSITSDDKDLSNNYLTTSKSSKKKASWTNSASCIQVICDSTPPSERRR